MRVPRPGNPTSRCAQPLDWSIDEHEPAGVGLPGTSRSILLLIDAAVEEGDLERAAMLEALIPGEAQGLPAVVDRQATIALLAGDPRRATALLATTADASPRLVLLRAVAALLEGDVVEAERQLRLPRMERSGALIALDCLLHAIVETERGPRVAADASASISAAILDPAAGPTHRARQLRRGLRAVGLLLRRATDPATVAGVVATGLRGVASDLGLDSGSGIGAGSGPLAVGVADRRRLGIA
jgi:hypothetical protein